ncbi:hypothetical protein MED193_14337 [Roseobacter sp. MED193]|nr:hypothetical protein MED193_14337 [Roseobacter sp. MED193]
MGSIWAEPRDGARLVSSPAPLFYAAITFDAQFK